MCAIVHVVGQVGTRRGASCIICVCVSCGYTPRVCKLNLNNEILNASLSAMNSPPNQYIGYELSLVYYNHQPMCSSNKVYTSSMLAPAVIVMLIARLEISFYIHDACKLPIQLPIQIIFIAAFGASQRNSCYLHGVRDYEFGVGLRKIVEHNTLAVVGAWP